MKPKLLPDTSARLSSLVNGFNFCTPCDAWMAATVVGWIHLANQFNPARDEAFRPPLVIITGPPGCGKTTLALRMAELACDIEKCAVITPPFNDESLARALAGSVAARYPAVLLDNYYCRRVSVTLTTHLDGQVFKYRPLGSRNFVEANLGHVTLMAINGDEISPDLARRAVVIHLEARPVVNPVKKTVLKPARKTAKKKGRKA